MVSFSRALLLTSGPLDRLSASSLVLWWHISDSDHDCQLLWISCQEDSTILKWLCQYLIEINYPTVY